MKEWRKERRKKEKCKWDPQEKKAVTKVEESIIKTINWRKNKKIKK